MWDWPFVARERELGQIDAAFDGGALGGLVIAGTAGAGKSRLARVALDRLAARGHRVEWFAATRAIASIPYGCLAQLLPEHWVASASGVGVLRALSRQVAEWGGRAQVVIAVDDAHQLDEASAAALNHLAIHRLAFVLATVRTGEQPRDAVLALWKDGVAERLDLPALDDDAVDELVERALDGPVEGYSRRLLREAAAGNPLVLSEVVRGGLATGALRQRYGVWQWRRGNLPAERITDLVGDHLRRLRPPMQRVVDLVACGEPLPLALLTSLAEPGSVEAAELDGLVVTERAGARATVKLGHPLYGDVWRALMPATRVRTVNADLATGAVALPMRRRDDALRTAVWQVESGAVTRPEIVLAGARQALARSDLALGERLARVARTAAPGPEADVVLAEILEYRGHSAEAAEVLSTSPPADDTRPLWAIARATTLYWGSGQLRLAEHAMDLAAGVDIVEAMRAWLMMFDGRCAEALTHARGVLDNPDSGPQAQVWAAAPATAAAGFLGRPSEADEISRRGMAIALADAQERPWGVVEIGYGTCLGQLGSGRFEEAWATAEAGYRAAIADGAALIANSWALFRGLVETVQGRAPEAVVSLREAIGEVERNDSFRFAALCQGALAHAVALTGDAAEGRRWLDRRQSNGSNRLFEPWAEQSRAAVAAATGALTEAVEHAEEAARLAGSLGLPVLQAAAGYDVVRYGGSFTFSTVDIPVVRVWARAGVALSTGDAPVLAEAAGTLAELGCPLFAAEAAAVALRTYRSRGRHGQAALEAERASVLRAACPGTWTPLLSEPLGEQLTRREREIALLAARFTSKEIALRLGLSRRTVDNNLSRAYAKLGVSGREALRTLLPTPHARDDHEVRGRRPPRS